MKNASCRRLARRPRCRFQPLLERLEDRRMLSATVTVNSTADTNSRDSVLTLREAILINNRTLTVASLTAAEQAQVVGSPSASDSDSILFNIPGAGPHTISPTSALPAITDPALVDGYSQPGAAANSNGLNQPLNTVLKIEVAGNLASNSTGLQLAAGSGGSTIRGLVVNRFANNIWIDSSGNTLAGNFIGTNPAGNSAMPGIANGVLLVGAANNTIGGANAADSNLISGNGSNGITIVSAGANNNVIQGNRIGTDVTGTLDLGNAIYGVFTNQAVGTTIGGTAPGAGNIISGNNSQGIHLENNSNSAVIQGNLIGVDRTGTLPLGNSSNGIAILDASNTVIGGATADAGNVIGNSSSYGIDIQNGVNTLIQGNWVGTNASGTVDFGNGGGISLKTKGSMVKANTVAFNGSGILVFGATFFGNLPTGNLISQNAIYSNDSGMGIDLYSPIGPNVPQDADDSDTGANNLQNFPVITSVANLGSITRVQGTLTSRLNSNYRLEFFASVSPASGGYGPGQTFLAELNLNIGGGSNTVAFTVDLPSLPSGQPYVTATATDITDAGSGPRNDTSEFSAAVPIDSVFTVTNTADHGGGSLREALAAANLVAGVNTITFSIAANDPHHFYYQNDGIAGQVSQANIATTTATEEATIGDIDPDWAHSWFSIALDSRLFITEGVVIDGYSQSGATENTNAVGQGLNSILKVEITGENAGTLPALTGLIHIDTGNAVVRGLAVNRVVGQKIQLQSGSGNKIEGNYLGTDVSGTLGFAIPFGYEPAFAGVGTSGSAVPVTNNTVGGTAPAARNLISGNAAGVGLFDAATSNDIQGNLIGSDRSGTKALANTVGIYIDGPNNTVGGATTAAGNLISGNETGVLLNSYAGDGNFIQKNFIGADATGTQALGNGDGLNVQSDNNTIRENTVAFNGNSLFGGDGIVMSGSGNWLSQNAIFSNWGIGIDLGQFGHDANDVPPQSNPPDQDTGANQLQNSPVLSAANDTGGGTEIHGTLTSTPNSDFRIEFFANRERDPLPSLSYPGKPFQYGQGKTYLGFIDVATNANGIVNFIANVAATPGDEQYVTATATDITDTGNGPLNNTSEFSPIYPLGGPSTVVTKTGDNGVGTLREAIIVSELNDVADTITFNIPADDPRHFYYQDDGIPGHVSLGDVAVTTATSDANIAGIDPDWPHSWFSIQPGSELPTITQQLNIDGYSQLGSSQNTLPALGGLNTVLKVELDGSIVTTDGLYFDMGAEVSLVQGLAINRFGDNAVHLRSLGGNRVYGNFLGVDISGTVALGNGGDGVLLRGSALNRVGGSDPAMRNLIAGNGANGIEQRVSGGDQFQGNLIGVDRTATQFLPNAAAGILLVQAPFETIGGTEPGAGNVIASDGTSGIVLLDSKYPSLGAPETSIASLEPLRSGAQGVFNARDQFFASNTYNDALQVFVAVLQFVQAASEEGIPDFYAQVDSFLGNQIFVVEAPGQPGDPLGIDLAGDGVTPNDPQDADGGPNNLRNFPVLTSAVTSGDGTNLQGTLNSVPNITFRIELFANQALLSSGYGPGEQFLGFVEVTTDGNGDASFNFHTSTAVPAGQFITATATYLFDLDENPATPLTPLETSEFSAGIVVAPAISGDFDSDGDVDGADFVAWQMHYTTSSGAVLADGDANADGDVDGADFAVWQSNFPTTPSPVVANAASAELGPSSTAAVQASVSSAASSTAPSMPGEAAITRPSSIAGNNNPISRPQPPSASARKSTRTMTAASEPQRHVVSGEKMHGAHNLPITAMPPPSSSHLNLQSIDNSASATPGHRILLPAAREHLDPTIVDHVFSRSPIERGQATGHHRAVATELFLGEVTSQLSVAGKLHTRPASTQPRA